MSPLDNNESNESETQTVNDRDQIVLMEYEQRHIPWKKIVNDRGEISDSDKKIMSELKEHFKFQFERRENELYIQANSYVGQVKFDHFDLIVTPKIGTIDLRTPYEENGEKIYPLAVLLRYVLEFDNLNLKTVGRLPIFDQCFTDILVYWLISSVRSLQQRGIFQEYRREQRDLTVMRGKFDLKKYINRGAVPSERIPCRYVTRSVDNLLNQILCAGLRRAARMTFSSELKGKCFTLIRQFSLEVTEPRLTRELLKKGLKKLNRLNGYYRDTLRLIQFICEGFGGFFYGENAKKDADIPGFFFDMNKLFERVIAKFLQQNLPIQYEVKPQESSLIYYSRKNGPGPSKPDIVVLENTSGKTIHRYILDTKYKKYDPGNIHASDLYQLTVYALAWASPNQERPYSIILHPAENEMGDTFSKLHHCFLFRKAYSDITFEEINSPEAICQILVRSINMIKLCKLIQSENQSESQNAAELLLKKD